MSDFEKWTKAKHLPIEWESGVLKLLESTSVKYHHLIDQTEKHYTELINTLLAEKCRLKASIQRIQQVELFKLLQVVNCLSILDAKRDLNSYTNYKTDEKRFEKDRSNVFNEKNKTMFAARNSNDDTKIMVLVTPLEDTSNIIPDNVNDGDNDCNYKHDRKINNCNNSNKDCLNDHFVELSARQASKPMLKQNSKNKKNNKSIQNSDNTSLNVNKNKNNNPNKNEKKKELIYELMNEIDRIDSNWQSYVESKLSNLYSNNYNNINWNETKYNKLESKRQTQIKILTKNKTKRHSKIQQKEKEFEKEIDEKIRSKLQKKSKIKNTNSNTNMKTKQKTNIFLQKISKKYSKNMTNKNIICKQDEQKKDVIMTKNLSKKK